MERKRKGREDGPRTNATELTCTQQRAGDGKCGRKREQKGRDGKGIGIEGRDRVVFLGVAGPRGSGTVERTAGPRGAGTVERTSRESTVG